jgi:hypothetical protein
MENDKSNEKPKSGVLSNIPPGIIISMQKQTAITDQDLDSLRDKVVKHGPALRANPSSIVPNLPEEEHLPNRPSPVAPIPQKPATMSYAIEGHVIEIPLDNVSAAIGLFYTLLAFVWSKDKAVAKILKQFDFKFFDANRKQIYPPIKKNVKNK